MPSKSKQQQKFMGIVRAIQKGDQPASKFSKKAQDAADDMKKKDVEDFASTKHKGLPKKVEQELREKIRTMVEDYVESCGYTMSAVDPKYKLKSPGGTGEEDKELKEEGFGSDEFLTKTEKKKFEKERLENAEVLGYTLTGTKDLKESTIQEKTFTPIDKIKDIKNLVKKGLVSYRGTGGGFEISIRNKKVPGFPPAFSLLQKDEKKYKDIMKKQFKIKPVEKFFIKSNELTQLKKFGTIPFLAPSKKESVNENLRPSDKKILMVIATELVKTQMKGKNKNKIRKELPNILSTMGTNDFSKKSPTNRFNKNKMISLGKGFGKLSDSDKKVFINTLMYNAGLAESINEAKEPEVITQLRDIVKRKTNKKIKDPKTKKTMRVDMFTANVVTQVYDAIKKNSSHRQKFESLPLDKMAQLSFKMMK